MYDGLNSTSWQRNVYLRWTLLPVLAHVVSWMAGFVGLIIFPILVTFAQYLILKPHPAIDRPGRWFLTLPITFFIWVKWGPYVADLRSHNIQYGVAAYYAGQLINALFIPLLIKAGKPEFLLNWFIGTLVAAIVWVSLYGLFIAGHPGNTFNTSGEYAIFIIYPTITLIANAISGSFLIKEYVNDWR